MIDQAGFIFPGQGTQHVGMGAAFRACSSAAADIYAEASDLVHDDVARLCSEADEATLLATENAQLALYVTNAAALAVLADLTGPPAAVAGHSVGEWSALYAAGAVSFADGLRAVRARARIMAELAADGGMVAIAGLDLDRVERLCADVQSADSNSSASVAVVAAENAPQLLVGAGGAAEMAELASMARDAGALRVSAVRTSHAFHSPLMAPAVAPWRDVMDGVTLQPVSIPVVLNVSGRPATDPEIIRVGAVDQIVERVRWRQCLLEFRALGVDTLIEVGDSKTLTTFARNTLPGAHAVAMGLPNGLRALRKGLGRHRAVR